MSTSLYRTYSSPNLRPHKTANYELEYDETNQIFFVIGDRVYLDGYRSASVAYFGEVEFAGGDWVGLVLDMPTGNHDGRVHGRRYFQCGPLHGLFARPSRVTRISEDLSRQTTPQPSSWLRDANSYSEFDASFRSPSSRASSALDGASYIYDDDYRSSPTISSLEQKIRLIENELRNHAKISSTGSSNGILKRPGSSLASAAQFETRADELSKRFDKVLSSSLKRGQSPSVFEFRPRRTRLEEYDNYSPPTRINSNPKRTNQTTLIDLSSEPAKVGDRVTVKTERGQETGILKYLGETEFATGEWAGVELDDATGKNDGSVLGFRYFYCPQNYGLFVPATRVKKITKNSTTYDFNYMGSTITSPSPTTGHHYRTNSSHSPSYPDRASSSASSSAYSSSANSNGYLSNKTQHQPNNYNYDYNCSLSGGSSKSPRLFADTPLPSSGGKTLKSNWFSSAKSFRDDYNSLSTNTTKPKFSDKDFTYQLTRSLSKSSLHEDWKGGPLGSYSSSSSRANANRQQQPKAVKYTFTSSKYDGSPIANRTLLYN